jgi:hypothetical protein
MGELIMSEREQTIESGPDSETPLPDRTIKCVDCSEDFIWTSGEQAFFHDKG